MTHSWSFPWGFSYSFFIITPTLGEELDELISREIGNRDNPLTVARLVINLLIKLSLVNAFVLLRKTTFLVKMKLGQTVIKVQEDIIAEKAKKDEKMSLVVFFVC